MESIIKDIEKEKRVENSNRLNQWTSSFLKRELEKNKVFDKEIKKVSDDNYNELHLKFHNRYPNLNTDEVNLVKDVFDFIKEN